MILEVADININADQCTAFEATVNHAFEYIFPRAKGFRGYRLHRCIETPGRYVLQLDWETLEDHTIGFRGSDLYAEWRSAVGKFFTKPPHVEHFHRFSGSAPSSVAVS